MARKSKPLLEVRPFGGLKQIGSNMVQFKAANTHIILDCGILFPDDDSFDINYLIPDYSDLEEPEALIISHGHEDHIGAIVHFVTRFPKVPIHAPPFAIELIRLKLKEEALGAKIISYGPNDKIEFKDFIIHPIAVNHSIPDTYGLFFKPTNPKEHWGLFYVSDFKVDFNSPYEPPFDFTRLSKLSRDCELRFLLADSTNILSKKLKTTSEADLIPELGAIFESHKDRIFITTFASNIHRIQTIISLAEKTKKKVVLYGRSMKNYSEIAHRMGILNFDPKTLRDAESIEPHRKDIVVIASGCQGDFRSAMNRIVNGSDRFFSLRKSDLVIFSSKAIPGNEKSVNSLINGIYELGAEAITDSDALIHASGHPGKEDLKMLCDAYKPHVLIPIHGESSFLNRHADAVDGLCPGAESAVMYNFDTLTLFKDDWEIIIGNQKPPLMIQGKGIIPRSAISQRRKIAQAGAVFISLSNKKTVEVSSTGLPDFPEELQKKLDRLILDSKGSLSQMAEEIRVGARRLFQAEFGYRPVVFVHTLGK
ncbi:MAG: hypothetical protein COV38_09710 [Bdellovibrionales bacterium CG11_big_fil_rev_8_21_14_0_20_38_13]|nr:MAG: hypothetical protein COV38_09710 [Bdellovibrionales bacterium CG11_big_fil_rev_8_21_14_0_20_38_13]